MPVPFPEDSFVDAIDLDRIDFDASALAGFHRLRELPRDEWQAAVDAICGEDSNPKRAIYVRRALDAWIRAQEMPRVGRAG